MQRPSRVFIVNNAFQHDYSKAERFGQLVSVTHGNVNVFRVPRLLWTIREAMKDYESHDYILLSGTGILQALTIMEALSKYEEVNILQFGAKTEDYVPGQIKRNFWPEVFATGEGDDRQGTGNTDGKASKYD